MGRIPEKSGTEALGAARCIATATTASADAIHNFCLNFIVASRSAWNLYIVLRNALVNPSKIRLVGYGGRRVGRVFDLAILFAGCFEHLPFETLPWKESTDMPL